MRNTPSCLVIDIETRSRVELKTSGVYRYAACPSTEVTLFGYAMDGGPVRVVDLQHGESLPAELIDALHDPSVRLVAHNAQFERVVLSLVLDLETVSDPRRWYCTSYAARCLGLPAKLEMLGQWFGLPKDMEGHRLMLRLCKPDRNGAWYNPKPVEWDRYKAYCARDVEIESRFWYAFQQHITPAQWEVYWDNERINDLGIKVDTDLIVKVLMEHDQAVSQALTRWRELTGLESWRKTEAVRQWLSTRLGYELPDIRRQTLEDLLEDALPDDVREAIEIRLSHGRAATAKFSTAREMLTQDGRLHGLYVAHAAVTGRYSSRGVQLHNLRRDSATPEQVQEWLDGNAPMPEPGTMVRSMLVPTAGHAFIVSDYSQIEARITAWLAGEDELLSAFAEGDDVYLRTYEKAFGLPRKSLSKDANHHERFIGKTMTLGCGFGAGVRGVRAAMGRLGNQFTDEQIQQMVYGYRRAYPSIPALWYQLRVTLLLLFYGSRDESELKLPHARLLFRRADNVLTIRLPSGRELIYQDVRLEQDGETVTYARANRQPKQTDTEWPRAVLSGPALVENIVQAIANDCLRSAIAAALRHPVFNRVVGHTHDELIVEAPLAALNRPDVLTDFERTVMLAVTVNGWAGGLPISCETNTMRRYAK